MHPARLPSRSVLGLWAFFAGAVVGFGLLGSGLLYDHYPTMLAGGALLAFSTLAFLFVQAWTITPNAVPNLWLSFAAATVGFVLALAGALAEERKALLAGSALLGFAVLVHLFVQSLAPAIPALGGGYGRTGSSRVTIRPTDTLNGQNFDHLLSHTLERAPAPAPSGAQAAPADTLVRGAGAEAVVTLPAGPDAAASYGPRHKQAPYIPAAKRRKDWLETMPLVRNVLDPPAPPHQAAPSARTRGQCGNCRTVLWAPAWRPIRIRCPKCGRTATLES